MPRTYTQEVTVYKFNELSDDAKAKAIENEREFVYETLDSWLPDEMQMKLSELLKQHKIVSVNQETPKIYYSLGYSQGDGAMFEGSYGWRGYKADISQSGHYYHYNSKNIEMTTAFGNEAKQSVQDEFNEIYVSICRELEKAGYAAIEGSSSDEALANYLESEDFEFTEEGKIA